MLPFRTLSVTAALVALVVVAPAADAARGVVKTTAKQRMQAAKVAARKASSPYSWGAAGPRAFDCSGLVTFAYRIAGTPLQARTSHLFRHGARVRRAALKRGDLVWT